MTVGAVSDTDAAISPSVMQADGENGGSVQPSPTDTGKIAKNAECASITSLSGLLVGILPVLLALVLVCSLSWLRRKRI